LTISKEGAINGKKEKSKYRSPLGVSQKTGFKPVLASAVWCGKI